MISIRDSKNEGHHFLEVKGSLKTLVNETGEIIKAIYNAMLEADESGEIANVYKDFVTKGTLEVGIFNGKKENDDEEDDSEDEKDSDDLLKELNDSLDKLLKALKKE